MTMIILMDTRTWLSALGFVDPTEHPPGTGLWRAVLRSRQVQIAVERSASGGGENLEARLARGYLRLQAHGSIDAEPCVVIRCDRMSALTERRLQSFIDAIAPGFHWLVANTERILGPARKRRPGEAPRSLARRQNSGADLHQGAFSDRFLVCVKTIAFASNPGLVSPSASVPIDPIKTVGGLAQRARISVPHAYRFVKTYEQLGFLERTPAGFDLRRHDELLAAWALHMVRQVQPFLEVRVSHDFLADAQRSGALFDGRGADRVCRAALGLHHAAASYGIHEVANAPLALYVRDEPEATLNLLGVDLDERSGPPLLVLKARFPEALWTHVRQVEHIPVCDLLQCYLDLVHHPLGGAQLAQKVLDVIHQRMRGGRRS